MYREVLRLIKIAGVKLSPDFFKGRRKIVRIHNIPSKPESISGSILPPPRGAKTRSGSVHLITLNLLGMFYINFNMIRS
jgi:hypothetical protein